MRALRCSALLVLSLLVLLALPAEASAAPARPKSVEITTVPPTPGARFTFDGVPLVTDAKGVARTSVLPSAQPHSIALTTPSVHTADVTSDFVRWHGSGDSDQGYQPVLGNVRIEHNVKLRVAFRENRTLRFSFVDQAHHPVDPTRVSSITLRNDTNQTQKLGALDAVALTAVRPSVGAGELVARNVTYSVQSVLIDGANVVNIGEQRFRPSDAGPQLQVVVLLRTAHFRVRDRLLGNPVATTVHLTYPDGRRADLQADAQGEITMADLARGDYTVSAAGQAYTLDQDLALSRSQFVDIPVLSYTDATIIGAFLLLGLVAVVGVGRWRSAQLRVDRPRIAATTPVATVVDEPAGAVVAEPVPLDRVDSR